MALRVLVPIVLRMLPFFLTFGLFCAALFFRDFFTGVSLFVAAFFLANLFIDVIGRPAVLLGFVRLFPVFLLSAISEVYHRHTFASAWLQICAHKTRDTGLERILSMAT